MGFPPPPMEVPVDLGRRLDHADGGAQQTEASDLERGQLARSQARVAPNQIRVAHRGSIASARASTWPASRKHISARWTFGGLIPAATLRLSLPPSTAEARTWLSMARALPARLGPRPPAASVASHSRTARASMLARAPPRRGQDLQVEQLAVSRRVVGRSPAVVAYQ